jgi:hypothetical protein
MALNSRILAAKSQFFGVMGMSNADKELVVKVRSTCSHLPSVSHMHAGREHTLLNLITNTQIEQISTTYGSLLH